MSIEVSNVSKRFGNFAALDDVSLSFPTGELIALLGPSGCGKTTLLRIIAGLEQPDSGRIMLEGEDASDKHVRERQVGFVFQHYALFRHMTVFENIAFGLRVKPRHLRPTETDIRKKVANLLELVQLGWLAGRMPSQLSGGQRQRVALARALAVEPRVLLLDEPFGALDAKVRKELRRWLRRLHEDLHITSIFVTHDQEEAFEVADRVVLMNQGHVEQVGTAREVYENPSTAFAYSFLGAVNAFPGHIEGRDVRLGSFVLSGRANGHADGANVVGFARPHELQIEQGGESGLQASVSRVLYYGAAARIELLATFKPGEAEQHIEIEMTREEALRLGLDTGAPVRVVPRKLKVFETAKVG